MIANILDIVKGTTVDGPGFRTSIYFAGCRHCCPGCHNPQSWDFEAGTPMSLDDIMAVVEDEDFDVTLTGGDPLYHPGFVSELVARIRAAGHSVWIYTGYTFEEILSDPELVRAIAGADVLVDSPFVDELRDTDLLFRGSSNQHILDIPRSLEASAPVVWSR